MQYYNIYHNGTRLNPKPLSKEDLDKITTPKHTAGTLKSPSKNIPLSECKVVRVMKI